MDMIAAIVGALDQRELFQSLITHTGRQHAQFGARAGVLFSVRGSADMGAGGAIRGCIYTGP